MYRFLNSFLHISHFAVISFSMFGFFFLDLLLPYLIFQFLILCTWLAYGFYDKRWGRCWITEVQWYLKELNGNRPKTESYIQYWLKYKFGLNTKEVIVDWCITIIYAITSIIGVLRFFEVVALYEDQ